MGKTNRNPLELSYLNSNSSWIKLQSSVNINGYKEPAEQNILLGGTLHNFQNEQNGKVGYWRRYGVGAADGDAILKDTFRQNSSAYNLQTTDGQSHELGLRPMAGITSLRIDSIGAYGSVRKATVNFQCWDIKQLEILEALYMRPGYTVLLEFGRNNFINSDSTRLINTVLKNNFFGQSMPNLHSYLTGLYKDSLSQGGHYDAFFGYVVNYKWSYRNDGGYDCMTEIISTGEVAESLKMNYSLAGSVKYTAFGQSSTADAQAAPFKGLILPKIVPKIANIDIIRFNNEYSENILSGLMHELYTVCRYEADSGSVTRNPDPINTKKTAVFIPKRSGNDKIQVDFAQLKYTSTADHQVTNNDPGFLFGHDNYYITLDSLCNIITEYNLPYAYDSTFETPNGSLTAISTNSRIYSKKPKIDPKTGKSTPPTPDPLLCLYNNLMISTNPDVCWINTEEWIKIAKGAKINLDTTPPPLGINEPVLASEYTGYLTNKINQWINDFFYDDGTIGPIPSSSKPWDAIFADFQRVRDSALNLKPPFNRNQLPDKPKFYTAVQIIFQTIRGGNDSTGLRNWAKLQKINSKLELRDYLRKDYNNAAGSFGGLIESAIGVRSFTYSNPIFNEITSLARNINTDVDQALQAQAPVLEQIQKATEDQLESNKNLNELDKIIELSNKYFYQKFKWDKSALNGTSLSDFGDIGNIYVNLKHMYYLAKNAELLAADPAQKNTISLGKFFDTLIQNIQTSLGNVNNFKIHIDPIDGVARIIDLNYINKDKDLNLFTFSIGDNKTIVRDLKLESQIFSNQISMVAISAQAEPGKLAYDNTSLTSYNDGIIDRNIVAKDIGYSNSNTADKELNFISNLAYLVKIYLSNLFGNNITDITVVGGAAPIAGGGVIVEKNRNYDANLSNSYSNSLRDLIAYLSKTGQTLSDNANKALLPTQLSLTIDGLAGFVIGNLFKVDNNFIPKFYKNSARNMGYTITGLNHDIVNNDWTTTIQAYPVDLSSNTVETKNLSDFSSIVYIDDEGTPRVDNGDCGSPTVDVLPLLQRLGIKYKPLASSLVTPQFYEDLEKYILPEMIKLTNDLDPKTEDLVVTSVTRPGDPKMHGSGNAIDFRINNIITNTISWNGTNHSNWAEFVNHRVSASASEFDISGRNRLNPYNTKQIGHIMAVQNGITNKFQGTPLPSGMAWARDLRIGGRKYRMLNEVLNPTEKAKGPHFHFMRLCSKTSTGGNNAHAPGKPTPAPSSSKPAPPQPPAPNPSSTPSSTPSPSTGIPIPSQFPTTTPTPTPTVTPTVAVRIFEAPTAKSTIKFPRYIQVDYTADGSRTNIVDEMHSFDSTSKLQPDGTRKIYIVGNGNQLVMDELKKLYDLGFKPIVTKVILVSTHFEKSVSMKWSVEISESTDGLAYTGFTSRGSARTDRPVSTSDIFSDPEKTETGVKRAVLKKFKYTPVNVELVADVKEDESNYKYLNQGTRHIRQVFYSYTDKNPEGIKPE
jgi:hypothetical protein